MPDKLTEIMAWKRREVSSALRFVPEAELAKLDASLPRPPSFATALRRATGGANNEPAQAVTTLEGIDVLQLPMRRVHRAAQVRSLGVDHSIHVAAHRAAQEPGLYLHGSGSRAQPPEETDDLVGVLPGQHSPAPALPRSGWQTDLSDTGRRYVQRVRWHDKLEVRAGCRDAQRPMRQQETAQVGDATMAGGRLPVESLCLCSVIEAHRQPADGRSACSPVRLHPEARALRHAVTAAGRLDGSQLSP